LRETAIAVEQIEVVTLQESQLKYLVAEKNQIVAALTNEMEELRSHIDSLTVRNQERESAT